MFKWLQIRTKEERKEYVQELLRPATKSEIHWLVCFSFSLLAILITIQNVIRTAAQLIRGMGVPWERVIIVQIIAIMFYVAYAYLRRSGQSE
jgi:hypothetical protein